LSPGTVTKSATSPLAEAVGRRLLDPSIGLAETQEYVDARIPPMPKVRSVAEWESYARQAREKALDRVVFRGEAAHWRRLGTRVEWLQTIDGGPGYKIKKLRYEAVPGLWIPALLYEPTTFKSPGEKVPVSLAVNGHDAEGKTGFHDQIDNHYARLVGFAELTSALAAGLELSQRQNSSLLPTPTAGQTASAAVGQQLTELGSQVTSRNLHIQPTIKVRAGYRFNVRVNRDLLFDERYKPVGMR
jgi:hypothetical protein